MILTTHFSAALALGPWLLDHLLALFPLGPPPTPPQNTGRSGMKVSPVRYIMST